MSEKLDRDIHKLLTVLNKDEAMRNFKKKYYEDFFFSYRDSISDINEEIIRVYDSPDSEDELVSAADSLVGFAKNEWEKTIFFRKTVVLVDMQCMMVFYVLPALLKNPPVERSKAFTDMICEKWNSTFKKSTINAADFDVIYQGFRTTIFGFEVEGLFGGGNRK